MKGLLLVVVGGCASTSTYLLSDLRATPEVTTAPAVITATDPDPDYPRLTPVDLLDEDPDRGPEVPITFAIDRSKLAWTSHAYCEDDVIGFACSVLAATPNAVIAWRVGRGPDQIVVEKLRTGAIDETFVHLADRRLHLDSYDRVVTSAQIGHGTRYRLRKPNGANALEGCGMMKVALDAAGRIAISWCLSWRGDPRLDDHGVATRIVKRNAAGFVIDEVRADLAGKPISPIDGVSRVTSTRAQNGRVDLTSTFDASTGNPLADRFGCVATRFERDERDVELRQTCLGPDGEPTATHSRGAIEAFRTDRRGCRLETRIFDLDGITPVASSARVHAWIQTVDAHCAPTRSTCADVADFPIACGPGMPARIDYDRDSLGRETAHRNYDANGRPGQDRETYAFEMRYRYDAFNMVERTCYGDTGRPWYCGSSGYSGDWLTWDTAGHVSEVRFNIIGYPATNLGVTSRHLSYDSYDHDVETQYRDEAGNPVAMAGASHRYDQYDRHGQRSAILLFDGPGTPKPADYTDCYLGYYCPPRALPWHAVKIEHKPDGTVTRNTFFGSNGKKLAQVDCRQHPCFD